MTFCLRHILPAVLLLTLAGGTADAQKRVSAVATVQSVSAGKLSTVTKTLYCNANGRMVTVFDSPYNYYLITNPKGEAQIYLPQTNEVLQEVRDYLSNKDELIYLFLSGRIEDLGLVYYGYKIVSSENEGDGIVRKTYRSGETGRIPTVTVVTRNFLPIYIAYTDAGGKVVSKTYFTQYVNLPRFTMPSRVTAIDYNGKDSVITRTTYTDIKVDVSDPLFDFQVPSNARVATDPSSGK